MKTGKKKSSSGRRLPTDFLPARNKPRRTKFLLRSLVIPEESNMPVIPVFCYFRQHVARYLNLITLASATTQFIFISLTKVKYIMRTTHYRGPVTLRVLPKFRNYLDLSSKILMKYEIIKVKIPLTNTSTSLFFHFVGGI